METAVEEALRAVPDRALAAAGRSRGWVLLAATRAHPSEQGDLLARRMVDRGSGPGDGGTRLVAGLGRTVEDLHRVVESYHEAFLATRAALLVPRLGDLVHWGDLGPYDLLLRLPAEEVRRASDAAALRLLADADTTGVLVDTLESFLDHAGDVRGAAEAMCVHRATLYYRLRRIEQRTGCSLASGHDRLALHLAVKLRRLAAVQAGTGG